MRLGPRSPSLLLVACASPSLLFSGVDAAPSPANAAKRDNSNPLGIAWGPAPSREDGPPDSANSLRDPAYLPAQIGGIVGSYALALVLVAVALLALAKRRREHLNASEEPDDDDEPKEPTFSFPEDPKQQSQHSLQFPYPVESPRSPVRNFSYPSPTSPTADGPASYVFPSRSSGSHAPGVDHSVDQTIVAADRQMAQSQLEEMYKHVMEQEAAKEAGLTYQGPASLHQQSPQQPSPPQQFSQQFPSQQFPQQHFPHQQPPPSNASTSTLSKREKHKPTSLNLNKEEKTQSRTSSILSALRSPRKKKMQGISISSPIMTPMSGTFPASPGQEMNAIPPRQYAPAAPPPVPTNQPPYGGPGGRPVGAPLTPDMSPQSTQSIDERIGAQFAGAPHEGHYRNMSTATTEADPLSAVSDSSSTPLVGLPSSPKPGVNRFPSLSSLPASPKPGQTFSSTGGPSFSRPNAPTAIRTGGSLPLRAYEPSIVSPSTGSYKTKQTVFERAPLSPNNGSRTPFTGTAVPYSPYQPFSPVMPITPSLVTKADRKRMKKMVPKTPTLEMVKNEDEVW